MTTAEETETLPNWTKAIAPPKPAPQQEASYSIRVPGADGRTVLFSLKREAGYDFIGFTGECDWNAERCARSIEVCAVEWLATFVADMEAALPALKAVIERDKEAWPLACELAAIDGETA